MNILKAGADAIGGFLGVDADPKPTVMEQVTAPPIRQPRVEPDNLTIDNMESYNEPNEIPEMMNPDLEAEEVEEPFDLGGPDDYDMRTEAEMQKMMNEEETTGDYGYQGVLDDDLGVTSTETQAKTQHLEDIKVMENRDKEGLVEVEGVQGGKFMPIESKEGTGPDAKMSEYEIGYGIKIPKTWLSKDERSWPKIDGVKVDISKGISQDQANSLAEKSLGKAYKAASPKLSDWAKMTEKEKSFWADLTYNGGAKAINKNPKAKAAANKGYTVEGMVRALDYIKSAGKANRGLLNRRISMYNQAALEVTGAPIIESYEFGKDIRVKFSNDFMTDKMSKPYAKKINGNDGWLRLASGSGETITREVGDNFKFEG